jgi:hypothetical protein
LGLIGVELSDYSVTSLPDDFWFMSQDLKEIRVTVKQMHVIGFFLFVSPEIGFPFRVPGFRHPVWMGVTIFSVSGVKVLFFFTIFQI